MPERAIYGAAVVARPPMHREVARPAAGLEQKPSARHRAAPAMLNFYKISYL